MIVHIGGDKMIPDKEIMMILEGEGAGASAHTRRFLEGLRQKGCLEQVSPEGIKSYVITGGSGGMMAYASPISSQTLYKRAGFSAINDNA